MMRSPIWMNLLLLNAGKGLPGLNQSRWRPQVRQRREILSEFYGLKIIFTDYICEFRRLLILMIGRRKYASV